MDVRKNLQDAINWIIAVREDGKPVNFRKRIGVTSQKVNNWRHGLNSPNLETIEVIATEYGLSLDWMIAGDISKAPGDYTEHWYTELPEVDEDDGQR